MKNHAIESDFNFIHSKTEKAKYRGNRELAIRGEHTPSRWKSQQDPGHERPEILSLGVCILFTRQ